MRAEMRSRFTPGLRTATLYDMQGAAEGQTFFIGTF